MPPHEYNKNCIWCASGVPNNPDVHSDGDYNRYYCPSCEILLAESIIARNGRYADIPPHVYVPQNGGLNVTLPQSVDWTTWEIWWTDYITAVYINGYRVSGSSDMDSILEQIEHPTE